jgi:predicted AAA+ superfamily ATPase
MKNVLDLLIDDFHERALPDLMPRHQAISWMPGKANVVIGMRRAGKTWFCYQKMKELLAEGIEKERFLYLNFEDERLLPFSTKDFQLILETYYRKFPGFKNKKCYLFLDEMQRIEGWEKFVRRVLDTEEMGVCITGSSSKLLSSEIATALRGRSLTAEIFPFSFSEFLNFHRGPFRPAQRFGSRNRAVAQNMFSRYLQIGGFPEVQTLEDEPRRQVLRNYLDVVILRDVVERYSVSNTAALRALIRHIMSAPATRFSINKFYNSLKSLGMAGSKNNLYDFLEYLSDAFLVYPVPIHARSERVRRVNPQKIYVIDPGLLGAMSFRMTGDQGAILENLVFLHFRRRGVHLEYYLTGDGIEIDFVVAPDVQKERQLIQVCWDISNPETKRREVTALLKGMKELGLKRGTIVTWLDEDLSDERVQILPAWKWLLDE